MTQTPHPAQTLAQAMAQLPLIAILRGLTPAEAPAIGETLVSSGFAIIEVPLNSPDPLHSITALTRQFPQALIGAGTVLNAQQVQDVHGAGGRLVVAPNFNPAVVAQALALNMVVLPGVATPGEVMAAMADGLRFLKFFPATAAGGVPMLKALAGPFPEVVFCPTGGLTLQTAPQYLALSNVVVCGGSWLTPPDAVASGDWARITRLAREASALRTA